MQFCLGTFLKGVDFGRQSNLRDPKTLFNVFVWKVQSRFVLEIYNSSKCVYLILQTGMV